MSHATLGPEGLLGRTQTHRSQIMTLWVTRQGQEFITSNDLQLSDVELISATCELVGEPGLGYVGEIVDTFNATINSIHAVNNVGVTSTVYNTVSENRIKMRSDINHGHVTVQIDGLTKSHQFRQDSQHLSNQLQLVVPTDLGLISHKLTNQLYPSTPIKIMSVILEQRNVVHTHFIGESSLNNRQARFVEDWADSPQVKATIDTRHDDGSVRWYPGVAAEGQSKTTECQVPANCIVGMKLVFNITPRTTL